MTEKTKTRKDATKTPAKSVRGLTHAVSGWYDEQLEKSQGEAVKPMWHDSRYWWTNSTLPSSEKVVYGVYQLKGVEHIGCFPCECDWDERLGRMLDANILGFRTAVLQRESDDKIEWNRRGYYTVYSTLGRRNKVCIATYFHDGVTNVIEMPAETADEFYTKVMALRNLFASNAKGRKSWCHLQCMGAHYGQLAGPKYRRESDGTLTRINVDGTETLNVTPGAED